MSIQGSLSVHWGHSLLNQGILVAEWDKKKCSEKSFHLSEDIDVTVMSSGISTPCSPSAAVPLFYSRAHGGKGVFPAVSPVAAEACQKHGSSGTDIAHLRRVQAKSELADLSCCFPISF